VIDEPAPLSALRFRTLHPHAGALTLNFMGTTVRLTSQDGHTLDAWLAEPAGAPRGGLVIAQEMYGVNDYIRAVCDAYAGDGYLAIAPALFDRLEPALTLPYDDEGQRRGKVLSRDATADPEAALNDLDAAADHLRAACGGCRVALLGYCFGGTLGWLAACRRDFDAVICYYGSDMCDYPDEIPRCPVICHVGDGDATVTPQKIAVFSALRPEVPFCIYPGALHGFDNHLRPARHHAEAAREARERTLEFLHQHIG